MAIPSQQGQPRFRWRCESKVLPQKSGLVVSAPRTLLPANLLDSQSAFPHFPMRELLWRTREYHRSFLLARNNHRAGLSRGWCQSHRDPSCIVQHWQRSESVGFMSIIFDALRVTSRYSLTVSSSWSQKRSARGSKVHSPPSMCRRTMSAPT
jgi:hypothetical protein